MKHTKRLIATLVAILMLATPLLISAASGSTIVIITRTGECYHCDGCRTLKSRIEVTLQEAVARGYRPCQVCNPPALDATQPTPSTPQPAPDRSTPQQPSSYYTDVSSSAYYYDAVVDLSTRGIIGGFPDGTFKPDQTVTRAQLATMLVNMHKTSTSANAGSNFTDVPKSHWAYSQVSAAAFAGFISGYSDGSFKPENAVTYNEALTMIVASLGYKMSDLGGTYPTCFTDKAKQLGILNTCGKIGTGNATRAEVCCFLSDALAGK